jgi:hypothetical protein
MENTLDYYQIQTKPDVWQKILELNPIAIDEHFMETFAGENSLYNQVPNLKKEWCEITRGKDIFDYDFENSKVTCIYTNPPFKANIPNAKNVFKYKNCVYFFLEYFITKFPKLNKIGFLINSKSYQSITPKRMAKLNRLGFYVTSMTMLNCDYWYGLYWFIIFEREPTNKDFIKVIEPTFCK